MNYSPQKIIPTVQLSADEITLPIGTLSCFSYVTVKMMHPVHFRDKTKASCN